jgi:hypothetical protein
VRKTCRIESGDGGAADVGRLKEITEKTVGAKGTETPEETYMFLPIVYALAQADALSGPLRPRLARDQRWRLAVRFCADVNVKVIHSEEKYV